MGVTGYIQAPAAFPRVEMNPRYPLDRRRTPQRGLYSVIEKNISTSSSDRTQAFQTVDNRRTVRLILILYKHIFNSFDTK
jgi:hypothetical protein